MPILSPSSVEQAFRFLAAAYPWQLKSCQGRRIQTSYYLMQIRFILLLLLFFGWQNSQAQIEFRPYDDAAKATAKANDQLILIEFTAGWCPPCKMMKKNVFSEKSVGDFYMANFVCTQVDIDAQGSLAASYDAGSIPNFVFVDAQGSVVHRGLGYQDSETFIKLGREALREGNKTVVNSPDKEAVLNAQPAGSAEALSACLEFGNPCEEQVQAFVSSKNWKGSEEDMRLILQAAAVGSEKALAFYKKDKEKFAKRVELSYLEEQLIDPVMRRALASIEDEIGAGDISWSNVDEVLKDYLPRHSAYRYQYIMRALIYNELGELDKVIEAGNEILSPKGLKGLENSSQSEMYNTVFELAINALEKDEVTANGEIPENYLLQLYDWLKDWEKVNPNENVYGLLSIVCAELGREEEAKTYRERVE